MRITELKKNIVGLVEVSDDKKFLEMFFNILEDRAKNKHKDILDDLSDEQMQRLDQSIKQVENGEVVSHEIVMKTIRKKISDAKKRNLV